MSLAMHINDIVELDAVKYRRTSKTIKHYEGDKTSARDVAKKMVAKLREDYPGSKKDTWMIECDESKLSFMSLYNITAMVYHEVIGADEPTLRQDTGTRHGVYTTNGLGTLTFSSASTDAVDEPQPTKTDVDEPRVRHRSIWTR